MSFLWMRWWRSGIKIQQSKIGCHGKVDSRFCFYGVWRGGDEYDNHKPVSAEETRRRLFSIQSGEIYPSCPVCGEEMHPYGRRQRIGLLADGRKVFLFIRRLWCPRCKRIHHELPDFLLPYKHFIMACIKKVFRKQGGTVCCENSTIYRWRRWFRDLLGKSMTSSLDPYGKGWLPRLVLLLLKG